MKRKVELHYFHYDENGVKCPDCGTLVAATEDMLELFEDKMKGFSEGVQDGNEFETKCCSCNCLFLVEVIVEARLRSRALTIEEKFDILSKEHIGLLERFSNLQIKNEKLEERKEKFVEKIKGLEAAIKAMKSKNCLPDSKTLGPEPKSKDDVKTSQDL